MYILICIYVCVYICSKALFSFNYLDMYCLIESLVEYLTYLFIANNAKCLNFSYSAMIFFELGFTPCKAEQPLQGMSMDMELQEE